MARSADVSDEPAGDRAISTADDIYIFPFKKSLDLIFEFNVGPYVQASAK